MAGFDHLDLVVSSLDRSLPFYRELLGPLGWRWVHEVEGERGETIHYLFRRDGRGSIGLRAQQSERADAHDRYAIGVHHVAFNAGSRRGVDRAAAWARERDVEIEAARRSTRTRPATTPSSSTTPTGSRSRS
jgi:glyoxylase I family protein